MSVLDEVDEFKKQSENAESVEPVSMTMEAEETLPEPAEPVSPMVAQVEATDIVKDSLKEAMTEQAKTGAKDIKSLTRDLTYMKGASDLQSNEKFTSNYQKVLAEQLIKDLQDEGKRAAIQQAAKKQEARNIRNQAFYDGCRPVFKMLNIDEAYGLVPMILTVVVLMLPFLGISFVRFVINSINSLFTAISKFAKPAFWICTIAIVAMLVIAAAIGLLYLIDAMFGTQIMQFSRDAVNARIPR